VHSEAVLLEVVYSGTVSSSIAIKLDLLIKNIYYYVKVRRYKAKFTLEQVI